MNIEQQRVLEFHDIFPKERNFNIKETLKKYDKLSIIKVASILGCIYDNAYIPNEQQTFFSDVSKKHTLRLNNLVGKFLKKHKLKKVYYHTIKTSLELIRHTFSIPHNEYLNTGKIEDFEYDLFRVILMINEDIMSFKSKDDKKELDELIYFNHFISNDTNNANLGNIFKTQLYYAKTLFKFLEKYHLDLLKKLIDKWQIEKYDDYIQTAICLFSLWLLIRKKNYLLDLNQIPIEITSVISQKVIDLLSIDINEYIPFDDIKYQENNIDYRVFRSKPLIKVSDKQYYIYNGELLIEKLYNSLFFDLQDIYKETGNFNNFYTKEFVENYLFYNTIKKCIKNNAIYFPTNKSIKEENNQPDFYIRHNSEIFIFECKAIKINGAIKDEKNIDEFIEMLKNKLYLKQKDIDANVTKRKNKNVGISQLVKTIEMIEDDNFPWDKNIPDAVQYFPILILEDSRFILPGLMSILNRWAKESIQKWVPEAYINPIIVTSIDILYLFDNHFKQKGFTKILSEFCSFYKKNSHIKAFLDFNEYMYEKYTISSYKFNDYKKILSPK